MNRDLSIGPIVGCLLLAAALGSCTGSDKPSVGGGARHQVTHAAAVPTSCAPRSNTAQPTPDYPAPSSHPLPARLARRLSAALRHQLPSGPRTGMAAAVVTPQGTWVAAVGQAADGSRLRPTSILAVGPVTNTVTAAEVLELAARHRIALDRKISAYVPMPTRDTGATVRDVLGMRSGLREIDQTWADQLPEHPDRHTTPAEVMAHVPAETDVAHTITNFTFSNYVLLGQLIEKITGTSYRDAVHRDLLDPAGLSGIAVQDDDRPQGAGYLPYRSLASAAWSAGGIAADAASIARWGYLLYGGRLPAADCLAQMPPVTGQNYGLGTESLNSRTADLDYLGHRGHLDMYPAAMVAVRGHPVAIAVLTVSPHGNIDPMPTVDQLAALAVQ